MPASAFGIVLFAALLHATWNAIVRASHDKLLTTIMVAGLAGLLAAAALPWLGQPGQASWPFMAASPLLQVAYFVLLARTYHVAEMSRTYPVMRGTAPLLVAVAGLLWVGERLSIAAWIGVGVICTGIFAMASVNRAGNARGFVLALLNAVIIAAYTVIDGMGVRRSGAPIAYTLWLFLLTALPLAWWAITARRTAFTHCLARQAHVGLLGGICSIGSYGAALWAMTLAPVAVVAALRETSILFGVAIAGLLLNERVGAAAIVAAGLIAIGAAVLHLA